jgi:hypothetical protein
VTTGKMDRYVYQIATRLDGKYYCRIFQFGVPQQLASTDDYDTEEEAIEVAELLIQDYQIKTDDTLQS